MNSARVAMHHVSMVTDVLFPRLCSQGFDKGIQSVGKTKTRFRKAPKTENVYVKLLVKVSLQTHFHTWLFLMRSVCLSLLRFHIFEYVVPFIFLNVGTAFNLV